MSVAFLAASTHRFAARSIVATPQGVALACIRGTVLPCKRNAVMHRGSTYH